MPFMFHMVCPFAQRLKLDLVPVHDPAGSQSLFINPTGRPTALCGSRHEIQICRLCFSWQAPSHKYWISTLRCAQFACLQVGINTKIPQLWRQVPDFTFDHSPHLHKSKTLFAHNQLRSEPWVRMNQCNHPANPEATGISLNRPVSWFATPFHQLDRLTNCIVWLPPWNSNMPLVFFMAGSFA